MALLPLPDPFIDGDFDTAVAVEGGPLISVDEITKSLLITRQFVVKADHYVPLPQGVPDPFYKDAFLVQETAGSKQGPMFFFSRLYAQLPKTRTEPRTVAFTFLGKSSFDESPVTNLPIGWNQYGAAQPNTRAVNGTSVFSYSIDPNTFARPPISKNTYNGNPVDFMGYVYTYIGQVKVNADLTEPRWRLAGATFYFLMPALWIQEVNVTRWRGAIWQMEVVQVLPYSV